MYRMLTLIWAIGVLLFASQAQAVAPMGESGPVRTAMISELQKSKKAHLSKPGSKSVHKTRRAKHRAVSRSYRVAHQRVHARSRGAHRARTASRHAARRTRKSTIQAYRSRRLTEVAQAEGVRQPAKRTRRVSQQSSRRTAKFVPAGTTMTGLASYYWQPQRVASGGWFNPKAMTAAHKTLPFGTRVRVTNKRNGRSVEVTINDRGPYVAGRIIDLSDAAAGAIGMKSAGVVPVQVEVVGR